MAGPLLGSIQIVLYKFDFVNPYIYLMKLLFLALSFFAFSFANAQKILMKINGITLTDGEEVLAFDWKNSADYSGLLGGGGGSAKAISDLVMIKKAVAKSTNKLMLQLTKTQPMQVDVIFEFFAASTDKDPHYRITLKTPSVAQFYYLAPECPTCLKLVHQIGFFLGSSVMFQNLITGESNTWDIANNASQ